MASFNVDEVKSAPVGASPRNVSLVDKSICFFFLNYLLIKSLRIVS